MVVVESRESLPATVAFESWAAAAIAHRMRAELSEPDPFTDLALEALALELTVLAARTSAGPGRVARVAAGRVIELLHDRACDAPSAEPSPKPPESRRRSSPAAFARQPVRASAVRAQRQARLGRGTPHSAPPTRSPGSPARRGSPIRATSRARSRADSASHPGVTGARIAETKPTAAVQDGGGARHNAACRCRPSKGEERCAKHCCSCFWPSRSRVVRGRPSAVRARRRPPRRSRRLRVADARAPDVLVRRTAGRRPVRIPGDRRRRAVHRARNRDLPDRDRQGRLDRRR